MDQPIWWRHGVIYQVYPRSFQDSDGDGVGDLNGVRARLDYLRELGVDAIWMSPIYPSPMADFGYDVSDHCAIHPLFGDMASFDALVEETHARGMKIILDLVPNHTSQEHPWFQESRRSRSNAKRDWYIWRDPAPGGGPPNNWISNFGGSAWAWDEASGQYYYHAFLKEQPDLNWRNPEVRHAMFDVMRFWLDKGVDGFRVDVIWHLIKDALFRDNPPNPAFEPDQPDINRYLQVYSADQPEVHDVVRDMRKVVDEYDERVLIGEIYLPLERLVAYYGADLEGAHLPFNFQLLNASWRAETLAALIDEYEQALPDGGWPNWVLSNHDQPRISTRVGEAQARVAAMLLLTLRGTPTLYYGDELGMTNVPIPPERVQDPWELNEPGLAFGRDPQRTPMQWDASEKAGFTTGEPWLPLGPDHILRNVETQAADAGSPLSLYRRLIALRRRHRALSIGAYRARPSGDGVLAYAREHEGERLLAVLNLTHVDKEISLPAGRILLSTRLDREGDHVGGVTLLRANEGLLMLERR